MLLKRRELRPVEYALGERAPQHEGTPARERVAQLVAAVEHRVKFHLSSLRAHSRFVMSSELARRAPNQFKQTQQQVYQDHERDKRERVYRGVDAHVARGKHVAHGGLSQRRDRAREERRAYEYAPDPQRKTAKAPKAEGGERHRAATRELYRHRKERRQRRKRNSERKGRAHKRAERKAPAPFCVAGEKAAHEYQKIIDDEIDAQQHVEIDNRLRSLPFRRRCSF